MADTMIDALLREREGYVVRGLKDRVAQVDQQLAHFGYKPSKATDAGPVTPTADPVEDEAGADDQPEPVEPKRTTAESKPRRRA